MLCVKTSTKTSSIHGTGLFANENISTGTTIWKFDKCFDKIFSPQELLELPSEAKIFLARHAYMSKRSGRYILDTDDARYFNHSDNPNSGTIPSQHDNEDIIIAKRDIKVGEEITIDYENQENTDSNSNILWSFYRTLSLNDEVDPRVKRFSKKTNEKYSNKK